ncbi:methionine--tRNA ligase [Candidatus Roizmanbacteria bacterium RIFCSPLOWO2_01_FULL_40_32]|nr:MAG: methionine--tRNA ligase [Candidatus Roizmanbacteria bacterium RIFCSPLOWO2_01_FULL_40_32]
MKTFFATTAIPYVNAAPHIGHALEFVQADAIVRYHRDILGEETLLLSGADENALKNVQAAQNANQPVQEFVDTHAKEFEELAASLNVQFDVFQKGTDARHIESSQKLWELCLENGDIYKKKYEGLYCVGCEAFYTKGELNENGECFEHPGKSLESVSEENYFFKLSNYQEQLIKLITTDELQIVPETRKNEMLGFLREPLQDISISRSNERAKNWGVPVPGDDSQRMYVWFDALNIYQSGVGFGFDDEKYKKWWPADVHIIGKGISRFHTVYWPAFLLSAKLLLPKKVFIHGYFTVDGQKMSKTLGNVIDPFSLIEKYGADSLRYYFLREIPSTGDGDFSTARFVEAYNANLANGLGNLIARTAKLAQGLVFEVVDRHALPVQFPGYQEALDAYKFHEALDIIFTKVRELDGYINEKEPWKIKDKDELKSILSPLISSLYSIGYHLQPFMPETAGKILEQFGKEQISQSDSYFPRI